MSCQPAISRLFNVSAAMSVSLKATKIVHVNCENSMKENGAMIFCGRKNNHQTNGAFTIYSNFLLDA